jgi:hypothetical protein
MATLRQKRYRYLITKGLLASEAKTIAGQYSMSQIRALPYLRALIKQRVAQRNRLQQLGYPYKDYVKYLKSFYTKNGWGNINNEDDIWKMIKSHRKDSIIAGDYVPPKYKGSHHKGDISKGDLDRQRARSRYQDKAGKPAKGRVGSTLDRIAELNARIKQERNPTKLNSMIAERNKLWGTIS